MAVKFKVRDSSIEFFNDSDVTLLVRCGGSREFNMLLKDIVEKYGKVVRRAIYVSSTGVLHGINNVMMVEMGSGRNNPMDISEWNCCKRLYKSFGRLFEDPFEFQKEKGRHERPT